MGHRGGGDCAATVRTRPRAGPGTGAHEPAARGGRATEEAGRETTRPPPPRRCRAGTRRHPGGETRDGERRTAASRGAARRGTRSPGRGGGTRASDRDGPTLPGERNRARAPFFFPLAERGRDGPRAPAGTEGRTKPAPATPGMVRPPHREGRTEIRPPRGRVRREGHSPPKVRGPWRPQNLGGASCSGLRGSLGWGFSRAAEGGRAADRRSLGLRLGGRRASDRQSRRP